MQGPGRLTVYGAFWGASSPPPSADREMIKIIDSACPKSPESLYSFHQPPASRPTEFFAQTNAVKGWSRNYPTLPGGSVLASSQTTVCGSIGNALEIAICHA